MVSYTPNPPPAAGDLNATKAWTERELQRLRLALEEADKAIRALQGALKDAGEDIEALQDTAPGAPGDVWDA